MELFEAIRRRRSIRSFQNKQVEDDLIEKVLEAGRWAPSGMNTQPWKFVVTEDEKIQARLSEISSKDLIEKAPVTIAILRDRDAGYHEVKDIQGIGACAQNMLLAAHGLGLGACWVGTTNDPEMEKVLNASERQELMLLIALGYPKEETLTYSRKKLDHLTEYL